MDRFLITENRERRIGCGAPIDPKPLDDLNIDMSEQYKPSHVDKPFERQPLDDIGLCAEERRLASNTSTDEFYERYTRKNTNNDKI